LPTTGPIFNSNVILIEACASQRRGLAISKREQSDV